MVKKCEICGREEEVGHDVGYCEISEMWVCIDCCENCYIESMPYGCPSAGLDFDRGDE